MEAGQWEAIHSDNAGHFAKLEQVVLLYSDIEDSAAWRDYQHRINQLRTATVNEIISGTHDVRGKDRTQDKRAVLFILDTLLSYLPALKVRYEKMLKDKEQLEARGPSTGRLHGNDALTNPLDK